jgi:hypothetical protein
MDDWVLVFLALCHAGNMRLLNDFHLTPKPAAVVQARFLAVMV